MKNKILKKKDDLNVVQENIKIFRDTQRLCKENSKLRLGVETSNQNQEFISEEKVLMGKDEKGNYADMQIVVSGERTLEAAKKYQGKQVCVLNFANAQMPGGGVLAGTGTQEEAICRCTTLYPNISRTAMLVQFYGPHLKNDASNNDDIIYTPGVVVFKSDTKRPELLPGDEWYKVNVITCAAPDLGARVKKATLGTQELEIMFCKRAKRILEVAKIKENQVLILGAFGCGDFGNPPDIVANAFAEALKEFEGSFETVEFAIPCSGKSKENYDVFKSVFCADAE